MAESASGIKAGRAFVEIGIVTGALEKGLNAVAGKLKAFGAGISGIGTKLMAAGTAVTAPLVAMSKVFASGGAELLEMSKRTGIAVEALSALKYAADRSGVDATTLEAGIRKMQKSLYAAAAGSETARESLAILGIDLKKIVDLTPDEQFKAIADGLAGIQDPALKAGLAMQLLGRGGTALLPMMENGAAGIEELENRAKSLGLVSSTQGAQSAKALSVAYADLGGVMKKISGILGGAVAPAIRDAARWLAELVAKFNKWLKANSAVVLAAFKLAAIVVGVGFGFVVLGKVVAAAGLAFSMMAKLVGVATVALGVVGKILVFLVSPIGLVLGLLAGLGAYFVYASGMGGEALAWLGKKFATLYKEATAALQGIGDAMVAGDLGLAAKILWLTLKMWWQKGIAALMPFWLDFKAWFVKVAYGAFYGVQAAWEMASHGLTVAWIETTAFLSKVWNNFSAGVQSTWDSVTNWVSNRMLDAAAAVMPGMQDVVDKAKEANDLQSQQNKALIGEDLAAKEKGIEADRKKKREAEEKEHNRQLAKIGEEHNDAIKTNAAENKKRIEAAEKDVADATKEWKSAVAAAREARAAKEAADNAAGKLDPARKNKIKGLPDLMAQNERATIGARGTFFAYEAAGLAAGNATDRLVKAGEKTADNTKKILEELKNNGLEFGE